MSGYVGAGTVWREYSARGREGVRRKEDEVVKN